MRLTSLIIIYRGLRGATTQACARRWSVRFPLEAEKKMKPSNIISYMCNNVIASTSWMLIKNLNNIFPIVIFFVLFYSKVKQKKNYSVYN